MKSEFTLYGEYEIAISRDEAIWKLQHWYENINDATCRRDRRLLQFYNGFVPLFKVDMKSHVMLQFNFKNTREMQYEIIWWKLMACRNEHSDVAHCTMPIHAVYINKVSIWDNHWSNEAMWGWLRNLILHRFIKTIPILQHALLSAENIFVIVVNSIADIGLYENRCSMKAAFCWWKLI